MKIKKPKMPSKSYLFELLRKAIIQLWGSCVFCGNTNIDELEDHHIIPRSRNAILKFDPDNQILVCGGKQGKTCHKEVATIAGKERVRKIVGEKTWNKLITLEPKTLRQYLVEQGKTEKEWLLEKKAILIDLIENC